MSRKQSEIADLKKDLLSSVKRSLNAELSIKSQSWVKPEESVLPNHRERELEEELSKLKTAYRELVY